MSSRIDDPPAGYHGTPDFTRRGISVLLVDGPGQGEAIRFRGVYLREDFEVAGSAALDYLATRADVDIRRVAIVAMSLGGYYAPRCAAMDPRYKACVAWGAIWDYMTISHWPTPPCLLRRHPSS